MAHQEELMDIDSDFDNKENSLQYNNVLFTEKGYEEVDVSDLNMKLRYSVTPAASPMSKSYTASDNRPEDTENGNLTRSLYSTLNKNELKPKLPLQTISSDGNTLRPQDLDGQNITVTVDDDLSSPSSSSSAVPTPATTPTKEPPKTDGGSPIMRGLKSVLNMFRSSQSPIPPEEIKSDILSPEVSEKSALPVLASTPIAHRKEPSPSKVTSPKEHRESLTFNEDLEKELQWKDETTILFSEERIPIHKLFLQQPNEKIDKIPKEDFNTTVEYMDISQNDSIRDQTMTETYMDVNTTLGTAAESDGEFVDCETTFTKTEDNDKTPVNIIQVPEIVNSGLRLKQIILNTTQDILDATLSITPEDLLPEVNKSDSVVTVVEENTKSVLPTTVDSSKIECIENVVNDLEEQLKHDTVDVTNIPVAVDILNSGNTIETADTVVATPLETTEAMINNKPKFYQTIDLNVPVDNTVANDARIIDQTIDLNVTVENPVSNEVKLDQTLDLNLNTESSNLNNTETFEVKPEHNQLDITETEILDNAEECNNTKVNETIEITEKPLDEVDSAATVECTATQPILDQNKTMGTEQSTILETPALNKIVDIPPSTVEENAVQPILDQTIVINATTVTDQIVADNTITIAGSTVTIQNDNISTESANTMETVENNIQELNNTINKATFEDSNTLKAMVVNKEFVNSNETVLTSSNYENNLSSNTDNINAVMSDELHLDFRPLNLDQEQESDLPADVPLPADDDNLEDLSLPHNLINNIKLEASENVNYCIQEEKPIQMNDGDKIVLTDVLTVIESLITDGSGDNIGNQIDIAEQIKPECDTVKEVPIDDENTPENITLPNVLGEAFDNQETNSKIDNTITVDIKSENDMQPMPDTVKETTNMYTEQVISTITDINNKAVELHDHIKSENKQEIDNTINISNCENVDNAQNDMVPTNISVRNAVNLDDTCDIQEKKAIDNNNPDNVYTTIEAKPQDEEITGSENNSPFVAIAADKVELGIVKENNTPKSRVLNTPPASPPIASKGYNFNFDEMDDPFATKTKIRVSPSLENIRNVCKPFDNCVKTKKEINNRRKSQPARKPVTKKKFNSTFDSIVSDEKFVKASENIELEKEEYNSPAAIALDATIITNEEVVTEYTQNLNNDLIPDDNDEQPTPDLNKEMHQSDETNDLKNDIKTPSSSEQSAYYSADASSVESTISKNVFNLPEIDDRNFNPFATKSKICSSPPPSINIENPFETKSKINSSFEAAKIQDEEKDYDKMETEAMEKDVLANLSSNTTSSKATDDNHTVKEINTEDEDTVEGPFLEADDVIDDRLSDCDSESNMIAFKEPFHQVMNEQADSGEMFIDAEAFEFLLNQNQCNTVVDSGKESLFLKFDPLFAKRMSAVSSDGVLAALNKVQKKERTPTKPMVSSKQHTSSPIPGPSNLNVTQDLDLNSTEEINDDLNVTVSKPMMVVPPAVNSVTPRNKSLTPNRSNRRSITFTSPAMAVIDRLLSLSGNSSIVHDTTVTQQSRPHNEADLVLSQLRELLAEKEISVYNLRSESRELQERLCSMESQVKSLEAESQGRLKNINDLNNKLAEKTKINKSMAAVVEEYERTIASLISETEQDKKRHAEERMKLISERDEQTAHLASMEVSFSDLHSKYEKSKQVILNCKANEDAYKKSIKEFEENLAKMQTNYELLKQHATSKLNHANQELEKINKSHEAEVLKFNAMIKRKELDITSLEESLAQKTKANEELTAICDELINKVG